jgi:iron complex transport system ATP-binding protein
MSEATSIFIETADLSVGFNPGHREITLFNKLNLALRARELVCFMGPNGIGKTSLMRTLAGLQKPLSGKVYSAHEKSISVVLTDRITASHMTVYELVCFGRYPYLNWNISLSKNDLDIIHQAISLVHIESLINKQLFELSDGQLQMVMLARALAQDTPVLILDEPTAHLDLNNRVEIMNILSKLSRSTNKAILLATHELDLALQTADRIWLATDNKSIVEGIPEDLVLNGDFDRVFQFKGFDLKTGKIHHTAHRNIAIRLAGEGHALLWTKNALERNGYHISDNAIIHVEVNTEHDTYHWNLNESSRKIGFHSIVELLIHLSTIESGGS